MMTLFSDASRVGLRMLRGQTNLPNRLLSTGVLLAIALGALCAMVVPGGVACRGGRRVSSPPSLLRPARG